MNDLIIEDTLKTFGVNCSASTGEIVIKGRSIPENSFDFFDPIFDWLRSYIASPNKNTKVSLFIEYFNTASSKCLLDIFKMLEELQESGKSNVQIDWYFEEEDEDMEYAGEDFKAIVKIPFKVISVEQF